MNYLNNQEMSESSCCARQKLCMHLKGNYNWKGPGESFRRFEAFLDTLNFFYCWALDVTANCICQIICKALDGFDLNTVHKLSCKEKKSWRSWDLNPGLLVGRQESFLCALPRRFEAKELLKLRWKICSCHWKPMEGFPDYSASLRHHCQPLHQSWLDWRSFWSESLLLLK